MAAGLRRTVKTRRVPAGKFEQQVRSSQDLDTLRSVWQRHCATRQVARASELVLVVNQIAGLSDFSRMTVRIWSDTQVRPTAGAAACRGQAGRCSACAQGVVQARRGMALGCFDEGRGLLGRML